MVKVAKMSAKKKPKVDLNKQDYQLELAFAKKLIARQVKLSDYPYYKSYVKTLKAEARHIKDPGRHLVIGCGPLPLSMLLIKGCTGLDRSVEAINTASEIVDNSSTLIYGKAEKFLDYSSFYSILLTLESGDTPAKKRSILKHIHNIVDFNTVLIVRSSVTKDFVNADRIINTDMWNVVDKLSVFDGLSVSYILTKHSK